MRPPSAQTESIVHQAFRYALDPTPTQERKLRKNAGAARFAFNWGLALVKERIDQRKAGEDVEVPWTAYSLRSEWTRAKDQVAPWWSENSKHAAESGFEALGAALKNYSDSKKGKRKGPKMEFPRFKRRGRGRVSFRYTSSRRATPRPTGRVRIYLPRIGHVRTHEPTDKLAALVESGEARILRATLSEVGGRWFCSFTVERERVDPPAAQPDAAVGVDAGVRHLAFLSTGKPVDNPRPLKKAQKELRRVQRHLDRQRRANNPECYDEKGTPIKGRHPDNRSKRMAQTEKQLHRLNAHVANIRRDAMNKLTTKLAAKYGIIGVEHLNVAGMVRQRSTAQAIHDSGMAELRRQLTYKTAWRGSTLVVADRFYPSSKTCSDCGAVKTKLSRSERLFRCEECGMVKDRDWNAALNLAALATKVGRGHRPTQKARSQTLVRPGLAGQRVDRVAAP